MCCVLLEKCIVRFNLYLDSCISYILYVLKARLDNSKQVYCVVVYFRIVCNDSVKMPFSVAKAKLAPLKPLLFPILELLGCFLISKLIGEVGIRNRIKLSGIFCWL